MGKENVNQIIADDYFEKYLKLIANLSDEAKRGLLKSLMFNQGIEYQQLGLNKNLCDNLDFQNGFDFSKKLERACQ